MKLMRRETTTTVNWELTNEDLVEAITEWLGNKGLIEGECTITVNVEVEPATVTAKTIAVE